MAEIFLSYGHRDAEIASKIAERFQQAGIDTELDRAELRPGDSWWANIKEVLEDASGVLLLLSPSSVNSAYVTREYQYALSNGKPLYIALIGALPTEEIPYELRTLQYVDLTQNFDENLNQLIDAIQRQKSSLPGARRLYQQTAPTAEADQVTLEIDLKTRNVDEVLEQVKKSLESGARTIKVVNVGED